MVEPASGNGSQVHNREGHDAGGHDRDGHDVVIVGASLAGCAAAIMLGRAGARVALVDQRAEPSAFKRICSHYVQSSAVATLERLDLLEPMMAAGAVRSRARLWTRWGWIEPPANSSVPSGINLRRQLLDPLIRDAAANTPGVELLLGQTAQELLWSGETVGGVEVRDRGGRRLRLGGKLLIGADGRDSRVAKLAGVRRRTFPHGRFAYGGYFEGPPPGGAPDASLWLLDPDMAAAFPTDDGLTFYACMPTKARLAEFRGDPAGALVEFVSRVPDAPPIADSRLVGSAQGKLDMTNVAHAVTAPGLALIGDAALAVDPLWGVGCGWALQSAEWLADSVAPALAGNEQLHRGLARYRRSHARALRGHAMMIYDYAGGRRMNAPERLLFAAAAENERVAGVMEAFGTRNIGPAQMMLRAMGPALAAGVRRSSRLRTRRGRPPARAAALSAGGREGASAGAG
jgi:2-polyprenyl-6-methoxyphenol hydroxylase-like FAD-dependent oxidoreductase